MIRRLKKGYISSDIYPLIPVFQGFIGYVEDCLNRLYHDNMLVIECKYIGQCRIHTPLKYDHILPNKNPTYVHFKHRAYQLHQAIKVTKKNCSNSDKYPIHCSHVVYKGNGFVM